jgi:hypothetical protein
MDWLSALLAFGLLLVWVTGLLLGATPWMTWLVFAAALVALLDVYLGPRALVGFYQSRRRRRRPWRRRRSGLAT